MLKTLLLISAAFLAINCGSTPVKRGKPVSTLCILDFETQRCWIDKKNNHGFHFSEMNSCKKKDEPCWFAIGENDLIRIYKGLNQGN